MTSPPHPPQLSALQVAGDSCGSGESLPGQRKLPWAVLLHREAPEVLSDRSYSGGKISTKGDGLENQSAPGVTTICFMQCDTSPSRRVDQVVDCGQWIVEVHSSSVAV